MEDTTTLNDSPMDNVENNTQTLETEKPKRSLGRRIWRFCWITFLALWGLSLFLVVLYKWVNPPLTPLMVHRFFQQVVDKDRPVNFERDYVSIDDISSNMVNAVVCSEDGLFMYHHGFDVPMLKSAYRHNKHGHHVHGGSTISMQTAKNAFLPHHRSYLRKGFEAYFTQLIEWVWGKKRIMEVYLNIIEFGDGIYGVEAASQHYFHHSASHLSRKEAAQLAVTLPAPLKRNPAHKTSYFRHQTSIIQARAASRGRVNLDATRDQLSRRHRNQETLWDFIKWWFTERDK